MEIMIWRRRLFQKRVILTVFSIFLVLLYLNINHSSHGSQDEIIFIDRISENCKFELSQWNLSIPILLIDSEFLKNDCAARKSILIGVNIDYFTLLNDPKFQILYYVNDPKKEYLDFRTDPRRIILRNFATIKFENIEVLSDLRRFEEYWKRSKYVECRNLKIERKPRQRYLPPAKESASILSLLRNELIESGMYPFIMSGTLLGWYRECSIIPHTPDLDMAIFIHDYDPRFLDNVKNHLSNFHMYRKFGMLNDSFELTMVPKIDHKFPIDLFFLYGDQEGGARHWMGGVDEDGTKYKFQFENLDPWCAGDLHGYLIWMTCTPEEKLINEYGSEWYLDHPTDYFRWNQSPNNIVKNGKWTEEQMKEVYNVYDIFSDK